MQSLGVILSLAEVIGVAHRILHAGLQTIRVAMIVEWFATSQGFP